MRVSIPYLFVCVLAAIVLSACSTTRSLPDDEQLYTGIAKIAYQDDPALMRKKGGRDSVGVITAVADAVTKINRVIEGQSTLSEQGLLSKDKNTLTKEERKAQKLAQEQNEKDFATAKEEVEAVLAYPPNNSIFGSSSLSWPWKIGLWVHNGLYDAKGGLGKWIYKTFGTDPVLISQVSPEMRAKVATNTLHNYGYFHGKVDYNVLSDKRNAKKAKVAYQVKAGQLYRLDSIAYLGFPSAQDSILRVYQGARLLKKEMHSAW